MALYQEEERTPSGKKKRERPDRKGQCFNTGRTHFPKGIIPWNKGKKVEITDKMRAAQERSKGVSLPKPEGFSEKMRELHPPLGRKQPKDGRELNPKTRVWRDEYVMVYKPEHHSSRKKPPDRGYVWEHRYIMELHLGRALEKTEVIHHLDGNKSNNDISNLLLCTTAREHNIVHTEMEMFVEKLIREGKVKYDKEAREFLFI